MIEISISKAVKNFGFKNVLDEFDLEVTTSERIALIGPNGCGKTTLFNIVIGKETLNKGTLAIRNGATIGMLSQMPPKVTDDVIVGDILMSSFKNLFEIQKV